MDFCFAFPLAILFADLLSVANGVVGCGRLISDTSVLVDVAFWKFSNNPPNSASVSDAMTFLIMLHYTYTGPFPRVIACIGVLGFFPRKKHPPALRCASGSDM